MNPIIAQQVALDDALVAPEDRAVIGKYNMGIDPTKTQKEATYQVVLDTLKPSPSHRYVMLKIFSRTRDLQLRVETYDVDMSCKVLYTTHSEPQGVIYEDKLKRKRLMRTNERYKFSDGTLTSVRNTLDQMLKNLMLGYNKYMETRKWTATDQKRTRIMIKDINQQLLNRRIMRSLEKFIGGRVYGTDYRLLQRTV
nr:hypothetical protein [Tanacetum cinerariifolium]